MNTGFRSFTPVDTVTDTVKLPANPCADSVSAIPYPSSTLSAYPASRWLRIASTKTMSISGT